MVKAERAIREGRFYKHPEHGWLPRGPISRDGLFTFLRRKFPTEDTTGEAKLIEDIFESAHKLLRDGGILTRNGLLRLFEDMDLSKEDQRLLEEQKTARMSLPEARFRVGKQVLAGFENLTSHNDLFLIQKGFIHKLRLFQRRQNAAQLSFNSQTDRSFDLIPFRKAFQKYVEKAYTAQAITPHLHAGTISNNALIEVVRTHTLDAGKVTERT